MVIFGFNTDIKFGETIYHVQSEERRHDALLQTQVFVRGRCIGKHATSYAHIKDRPDFTEEQMHELLKAQHKIVVDAVREGRVDEVLRQAATFSHDSEPGAPQAASSTEYSVEGERANAAAVGCVNPPPTPTLELQFVNPDSIVSDNKVCFRFLVAAGGAPVNGANLVARFQAAAINGVEAAPVYAKASTGSDGRAEIVLEVTESALHLASLLVQAAHSAEIITRKFRLKGK